MFIGILDSNLWRSYAFFEKKKMFSNRSFFLSLLNYLCRIGYFHRQLFKHIMFSITLKRLRWSKYFFINLSSWLQVDTLLIAMVKSCNNLHNNDKAKGHLRLKRKLHACLSSVSSNENCDLSISSLLEVYI